MLAFNKNVHTFVNRILFIQTCRKGADSLVVGVAKAIAGDAVQMFVVLGHKEVKMLYKLWIVQKRFTKTRMI